MSDLFDEDMPAFRGRLSGKIHARSQRSSSSNSSSSSRHRSGRGRHVSSPSAHSQRVVVQVQSRRTKGDARASAYMRYLLREGVGPGQEQAELFSAGVEPVEPLEFLERSENDRHQFRVIVSPESGDRLDLEDYTRDLVRTFEEDLGTRLDWAAVAHYNTSNPHVHLVIRGVDQDGADLYIKSDYLSQGMRRRAQELATFELGPRSEQDVLRSYERQIDATHWTELDRELLRRSTETSVSPAQTELELDLSRNISGVERSRNAALFERLEYLQRLGLAACVSKTARSHWRLDPDLESQLRELGESKDIVRRMYAAHKRDPSTWAVGPEPRAVIGQISYRGLHDERTGEEFVVVDGVDGKAHYLRMGAYQDASRPELGAIVEVKPGRPRGEFEVLATRSLASQTSYAGPCWVDKTLLQGTPNQAERGFGRELGAAQNARVAYLQRIGVVAEREIPQDLLKRTRALELETYRAQLAKKLGKSSFEFRPGGPSFEGTLRAQVNLQGGSYTVVESKTAIAVVPTDRFLQQYAVSDAPRIRLSLSEGKGGRARLYSKELPKDKGRKR